MILERTAPAKINLGLHVLRKRADGYHDIETIFVRIDWSDLLRASPADRFSFSCSDPSLPLDERNLCVRAARLLAKSKEAMPGVALRLEKRVPHGAGLGGGSSDAAAALLLLREFWQLDIPDADLRELALSLGSDVPFFLGGGAWYGTGRGEILEPLIGPDSSPYRCPFWFLVAAPGVHISTAEAYRGITPLDAGRPDLKLLVESNDLALWRTGLVNDFERSVFEKYPGLARLKQRLLDAGAGYAAMSGSGSTLFGVFEDSADAQKFGEILSGEGIPSIECRVPNDIWGK